jgi:hypothetical protein
MHQGCIAHLLLEHYGLVRRVQAIFINTAPQALL